MRASVKWPCISSPFIRKGGGAARGEGGQQHLDTQHLGLWALEVVRGLAVLNTQGKEGCMQNFGAASEHPQSHSGLRVKETFMAPKTKGVDQFSVC